jgi:hypothetical protein
MICIGYISIRFHGRPQSMWWLQDT